MICKMANGYDAVSLTIDSYLSQNAENSIENSEEKIYKNRDEKEYKNDNKNDNKNEIKNENENEMFSQKRVAAYDRWQAVPHTPYKKVIKL